MRMVFEAKDQYESQWEAIESIAQKIGCTSETLRHWVRQSERDLGLREGPSTAEQQQRIKDLEREVRELRRANEILKLASAYRGWSRCSPARKELAVSIRCPRSPLWRPAIQRMSLRPRSTGHERPLSGALTCPLSASRAPLQLVALNQARSCAGGSYGRQLPVLFPK